MRRYKLRPLAPFHIGERGVGIEETADLPHSDTLFAALVAVWRLMIGEERLDELLAAFPTALGDRDPLPEAEPPPVRLSSALPYAGSVYFLPRPKLHLDGEGDDTKTGKQVEYVSWGLMSTMLNSVQPPRVRRDNLLHHGQLWLSPADRRQLAGDFPDEHLDTFRVWYSGDATLRPRVTVGRVASTPNLYHQGQVRFRDGCGLYILAEYHGDQAETYRKHVENGLRMLGEQGLGGRRSIGLGRFELVEEDEDEGVTEVEIAGPGGPEDPHLLLSLYHPTWREVQAGILNNARYDLILRRGWMFSPDSAGLRRKGLRMLGEGAILPHRPAGDVRNVKPDPDEEQGFEVPHPVYRSGLALSIPAGRWQHV